jgi:hypothetical protein
MMDEREIALAIYIEECAQHKMVMEQTGKKQIHGVNKYLGILKKLKEGLSAGN